MRLIATSIVFVANQLLFAAEPQQADVLVYGGTAGGVIAAVSAAQEGASVVLIGPGRHVGGMVSGGLGATDYGNKTVIGGASREFFEHVGKHYDQPIAWHFEPHVAEQVFTAWLKDAHVKVVFGRRIEEVLSERGLSEPEAQAREASTRDASASAPARKIARIKTDNGDEFAAKVFIDCSYEGDLMAQAGVSYAFGREGMDQYGESLAGRREVCKFHQFSAKVSPFDDSGKLLPCVYGGEPGAIGQDAHQADVPAAIDQGDAFRSDQPAEGYRGFKI